MVVACGSQMIFRDQDKPVYLYVWGIIGYDDGFGKNRTTKFCHRYNWIAREPEQPPGHTAVSEKHGRYHEHGNDAD